MPSPITPEAARATALRMFDEGTHLHPDYRLRAFPLWPDHIFHGNTNIQLTVAAGLTAAMHLRNQPDLQTLVARQLQWVFGGNPFAQSLMYGEGYDFQPQFMVALPDIVGAVPVGINSLHNDAPFWSTVSQFTFKEMWIVPTSRLLQTLAAIAVPARVQGKLWQTQRFVTCGGIPSCASSAGRSTSTFLRGAIRSITVRQLG